MFLFIDDLDLHVITPENYHIFHEQPVDVTSGGRLDEDVTPFHVSHYEEHIHFDAAPMGQYQFYVVNHGQFGDPDAWSVTVRVDGQVVDTQSGTIVGEGNQSPTFVFDFDPSNRRLAEPQNQQLRSRQLS